MVKAHNLNFRFLILQSMITALSCVGGTFIPPILLRFEYSAYQIGVAMTLAALASALVKPLWGYLHDRYSASKQIVLTVTAAGCLFYILLIESSGKSGFVEVAVMGIYMTIMSMMSFIDSWAIRLISDGHSLNYGITRSGGSFSYAVIGFLFGILMSRYGIRPGIWIVLALFTMQSLSALTIPNPSKRTSERARPAIIEGIHYLANNKPFILLLSTYFLSTIAMCATESFFAVRIVDLGGTEKQVGIGLFLSAMSEIPIMFLFNRFKRKVRIDPAVIFAISLGFYGLKCIGMGLAPTYQFALAATMLNGLSFGLFILASIDYVLRYVKDNFLATAYLFSSALGTSLGAVVGNYIDGVIAQQIGVGRMMVVASLFSFIPALLILILQSKKQTSIFKEAES